MDSKEQEQQDLFREKFLKLMKEPKDLTEDDEIDTISTSSQED